MEAYWLREEGKEVDWTRAEISALSLTVWGSGSDPKNRHTARLMFWFLYSTFLFNFSTQSAFTSLTHTTFILFKHVLVDASGATQGSYRQEAPEISYLTFGLLHEPLYCLSHSHLRCVITVVPY